VNKSAPWQLIVMLLAMVASALSSSGDWFAWFGDRSMGPGQMPPVLPPDSTPQSTPSPLMLASTLHSNQVRETFLTARSGPDDVEPWVASNPMNPRNFIVAGISWSQGQSILVAATLDSGITWHRSILPRAPDAVFHADPAVVFDAGGVAHLVNIPAEISGNSGVPLGIEVSRSLDGGLTWTEPRRISANRGKDDKTAIAADTAPNSPNSGRIYVAWKWPGGGIYVSRSDDTGQTYSTPNRVSDDTVSGLSLATLSDGTVLLAANRGVGQSPGIVVYRSVDGGINFSAGIRISTTRAKWYLKVPANCGVGALVQTSMAVVAEEAGDAVSLLWDDHRSGSPESCSDACFPTTVCHSQTFVARSLNAGQTWQVLSPATPPGFSAGDQFFSWLTADAADGTLLIAQRSSHEAADRRAAHTWLLRSENGGDSWEAVARLSSGTSAAEVGSFWQGDYIGVAASEAAVVAAWTDLRFASTELYAGALDLSETITITAAFSGAWYDPAQNGHGFHLQVLDGGRVLIYWFTFDSEGRPAWMYGVGHIEGEAIGAELFYEPDGPRFPPDYDPADFEPIPWGSLELFFFDCDHGLAEWNSQVDAFDSGLTELTRLTNTATLSCQD